MKRLTVLSLVLMAAALAFITPAALADAAPVAAGVAAADVAPPLAPLTLATGSAGWDLALSVVLPLLVVLSSFFANFFTIKEADKPGLKAVKKIVNTLALNLSPNAGK